MNETIRKMLDLQGIDLEIRRLQKELHDYREHLDRLRAEFAKRQKAQEQLQARAADVAARRRKLEDDEKVLEEEIRRATKRMEIVRTPRELEAATHQVETARAHLGEMDEQLLLAMEEEEATEARLKEAGEAHRKFLASATAERARLEPQMKLDTEMLEGLKTDRARAAAAVPADNLRVYEWLWNKHGQPAVVRLEGGACGGCEAMLPPGLVVEVRTAPSPAQCTYCLRYIHAAED